ncbi:MAG: hypothetical protein U9R21_04565, partial [Candidatus Thermoplasmatota archaeon]|nr:hypothetical protein [Candidatus Thermoplasmatota archaeon]
FVRNLKLNPIFRFGRIRDHLIKNNALKTSKIGNSKIEIIRAKQTFGLISEELNKDPYWLVKIENNGVS